MKQVKTAFLVLSLLLSTGAMAMPFATSSAEDEVTQQEKLRNSSRYEDHDDNNVADQCCEARTWCPRGYQIWCSSEGVSCYADKWDRSYVYCAAYDQWGGLKYQSSDYCY
jgi:hypothetical protein